MSVKCRKANITKVGKRDFVQWLQNWANGPWVYPETADERIYKIHWKVPEGTENFSYLQIRVKKGPRATT